jgi:tetratricopeptide (TPR) repeat protein
MVALVGEAGVGKSRLVYEFTHSHRVQDWLILEASSVSYGKATSYLPVIDLLKGYCKIGDRDDHREMRAKVLGRVLGLDRALEPLLPPLLALLDTPVEDLIWGTLDPPERRRRTLDAVKRLLLRESQVQPLLVVFEDLHWIDAETQALLDSLVESLGSARLLLLVNYRPEYAHRWGSKTAYSQLRLDSLPAESAAELLAALLGPDPGLAPLAQRLVKRGNPFFLEETVRTLVETGALAGERGAYRLTRPVEALQVPATVQTILAVRIDRLPAEEKQLLQGASVIGKDVPYALLAAITEQPEEALRRGLAHLQEAELLYETQLFPDLEYTFKHALTHEVAYESLLRDRRQALHRRIVSAIEELSADRLTEQVERVAQHAARGELWDKAVSYLRQAATKALSRSLTRLAAAYLEDALAALRHLPENRETQEEAIDIRLDLRAPLFRLGELARLARYAREALTFAEALGDQRRVGRAASALGHYFCIGGDADGALSANQRAVAIAETLADRRLLVPASYYLGMCLHSRGDYKRSIAACARSLLALEGDQPEERTANPISVFARVWSAWGHAELGAFPDGMALAAEAVQIAKATAQPFDLLHAYVAVGLTHVRRGDAHHAIPLLEQGLDLCERAEVPIVFGLLALPLGAAYLLAGRTADAMSVLELANEQTRAFGVGVYQSLRLGSLAEAHLLADRRETARAIASEAIQLARIHQERGQEAWALRLLAEIASHPGVLDRETAEDHYHQAHALAEELGMRPLVAHCHLGLGKLYRGMAKRQEAHKDLTVATTMYGEMGMTYWLEKAARELD